MRVLNYCASIMEGFPFFLHWRKPYSWSHVQLGFSLIYHRLFFCSLQASCRGLCEFLKWVLHSSLGVESTVSPPSLAHKEVASTPSPQRDVVHFYLPYLFDSDSEVFIKACKFRLLEISQLFVIWCFVFCSFYWLFSTLVFTFQFSRIFIGMCSLDITVCFIKASKYIMYFELINSLCPNPAPLPYSH